MHRPRRRVLQSIGAGLFATAGCLGERSSDGTSTPTNPPPSPAETTEPTEPDGSGRLQTDPGGGFRWSFDIGAAAVAPLIHDGMALTATSEGVVRAFDADGAVRWRTEMPNAVNSGAVGEPFTKHHGFLLVVSGENRGTGGEDYRLHAIDPDTGREHWQYSLGRDWIGVLGAVADGIAIGEGDDAVGASRDQTALVEPHGEPRWSAETGDPNTVADGGGRIYVGAYGAIRAFDAESGEQRWRVDTTPEYKGLAGGESRLYAVEEVESGAALVARDGATGEERWRKQWFATSVHRTAEKGIIAGGERLAAFAPDGAERWDYAPGGSAYGPATGETLFTGPGGSIAAVAVDDGTERWRTSVEDADSAYPQAHGDGVVVSEVLGAGRYVAHDAGTGEHQWSVTMDADRNPGVAIAPETVYIVADDGTLLARNPQSRGQETEQPDPILRPVVGDPPGVHSRNSAITCSCSSSRIG